MTEAQFTTLVQGLRTEASHWFNNAALLELEKLITLAERGFAGTKTIESPPSLPTPSGLTSFELKILREVAGLEPISSWGAAVGAALEFLRGSGYITPNTTGVVEPTAKGRMAIERAGLPIDNPPSGA